MSAAEIIKELPKLSEIERRAILEKLRELARQDDAQWERLISDLRPLPKLEEFFRQAAAEGGEEVLNPDRIFGEEPVGASRCHPILRCGSRSSKVSIVPGR